MNTHNTIAIENRSIVPWKYDNFAFFFFYFYSISINVPKYKNITQINYSSWCKAKAKLKTETNEEKKITSRTRHAFFSSLQLFHGCSLSQFVFAVEKIHFSTWFAVLWSSKERVLKKRPQKVIKFFRAKKCEQRFHWCHNINKFYWFLVWYVFAYWFRLLHKPGRRL